MDSLKLECALVIVVKRPSSGRVKTRLIPVLSPGEAAELATSFLQDAFSTALQLTKADLFIGYSPLEERNWFADHFPAARLLLQGGGDLGERMARLCGETFALGYAKTILIGADAPFLTSRLLQEARQALDAPQTVVLGPAFDGGYYLLGLNEPAPWLFEAMTWSDETVLKKTLMRIAEKGHQAFLLQQERDIDTPDDLLWLEENSALLNPGSSTANFMNRRNSRV